MLAVLPAVGIILESLLPPDVNDKLGTVLGLGKINQFNRK